jgi:hypothetical protein
MPGHYHYTIGHTRILVPTYPHLPEWIGKKPPEWAAAGKSKGGTIQRTSQTGGRAGPQGRPHLLHSALEETMPRGKARAATFAATSRRQSTGAARASRAAIGWRILRVSAAYRSGLIVLTLRPWWRPYTGDVTGGYVWFQASRVKRTGSSVLRRASGLAITFTTYRPRTNSRRRLSRAWRGNLIVWTRVI